MHLILPRWSSTIGCVGMDVYLSFLRAVTYRQVHAAKLQKDRGTR